MASCSWQRTEYAGRWWPARAFVLVVLFGSWLAFGAAACSSTQGTIEQQSIVLASGEYYGLSWGGTQVERFHVVAHRGTADGEVVIVSPQHAQPCSLGLLSDYTTVQPENGGDYVVGSPSPARIGIFESPDASGRGLMRFSDVDCKLTPLQVPGVLPSSVRSLPSLDLSEFELAVPLADRSLAYVQPWADKQAIVAQDVISVSARQDGVWLIEHGQAVARDHDGKELARYGHGVRELLPLGKALDLAFVDDSGLQLHQLNKTVLVEKDACQVRSLGSFLRSAVGYFSPCSSKHLAVYQDQGSGTVQKLRYTQVIDSLFVLGGRLLFTVATGAQTEFWTVSASQPKQPVRITTVPHVRVDSLWSLAKGRYLLSVHPDDGTLGLLRLEGLRAGSQLTSVAHDLTSRSVYESTIAITKADDTLTLLDLDDQHLLWRIEGVLKSGYRFLFGDGATAVAYLQNVDPASGTGQLELQFLSGEQLSIAPHVREFHEVWWPERGLVYATGGADPTLSFARIDVPCQQTSDSPWACGF